MQDRYTGDVGDFAKYGLLRQLLQPSASGQELRLAVLWYLIDDEDSNSDGKYISYLRDNRLRSCDPVLHDTLKVFIDGNTRKVASLETSGLLAPDRTVFYSDRLASVKTQRQGDFPAVDARRRWFSRALEISEAADLVFLDPDNGLEVASVPPSSPKASKYVFLHEVAAIAERGQSLLIYQHHNRSAPAEAQIALAMKKLRSAAPHSSSVIAITFRGGSVRSFFLLVASSHREILHSHMANVKSSTWASYFGFTEPLDR
jgi:hypothetical protein